MLLVFFQVLILVLFPDLILDLVFVLVSNIDISRITFSPQSGSSVVLFVILVLKQRKNTIMLSLYVEINIVASNYNMINYFGHNND